MFSLRCGVLSQNTLQVPVDLIVCFTFRFPYVSIPLFSRCVQIPADRSLESFFSYSHWLRCIAHYAPRLAIMYINSGEAVQRHSELELESLSVKVADAERRIVIVIADRAGLRPRVLLISCGCSV